MNETKNKMTVEQSISLGVLVDVNNAYNRGDLEFDGSTIQSAMENAIDGLIEAGFSRACIKRLRSMNDFEFAVNYCNENGI